MRSILLSLLVLYNEAKDAMSLMAPDFMLVYGSSSNSEKQMMK